MALWASIMQLPRFEDDGFDLVLVDFEHVVIQTRCVERDLLEKVIAVIIFNQHGSLSMKAHLLSLRRLSQHICRYSIFQLSHHFIDMHLLEG